MANLLQKALFSLVLIFLFLTSATLSQQGRIEWIEDLDKALEVAIKSNKPLFVVFRCIP
ncbi:MAG: hypothetical protein HY606_08120 [Planctomycetes bacterium]|nr:hypothetical protein [Planctomycetota bacterium]